MPCPYRQLWVSFTFLNQTCPDSYNQINSFCKSTEMNITEEDEKHRLFTPLKITQNKFTGLLLLSPQSGQTSRRVRAKILTRIFSTVPMTQCSAIGHQNGTALNRWHCHWSPEFQEDFFPMERSQKLQHIALEKEYWQVPEVSVPPIPSPELLSSLIPAAIRFDKRAKSDTKRQTASILSRFISVSTFDAARENK